MKHTEATKRKLSEMRRGARNPFYGKKHSPETRAKLQAVLRSFRGNRTYKPSPVSVTIPVDEKLGYLAGIIDGEGSIGVRGNGVPYISVYNTSRPMLEWLTTNVGGSVGGSPDRRGRQPCFHWSVQARNDVLAILAAITPLLTAKIADAQRVQEYVRGLNG